MDKQLRLKHYNNTMYAKVERHTPALLLRLLPLERAIYVVVFFCNGAMETVGPRSFDDNAFKYINWQRPSV